MGIINDLLNIRTEKEQVNHPDHYQIAGRKECWDEFIDRFGAKYTFVWCLMTAQKYLYRKGLKDNNSEEQDLNKALAYFRKATSIRMTNSGAMGTKKCSKLYHDTFEELKKYDKI